MEEVRTKIQKRDFRGKVRHGAEWLQLWAHPEDDLTALELSDRRQHNLSFERQRQSVEKLAAPLSGLPDFSLALPEARADWNAEQWSVARGSLARKAFLRRFPHSLSGLADRIGLARATALGLRQFPGLFPDLQAVSFKELEDAGCGHAFLAAQLPLERALVLVLTDRWSGQAQPLWNSGAVEMWAAWLNRKCPRSLPALDASLHQPGAFADAAQAFLEELAQSLTSSLQRPTPSAEGERGETGEGQSSEDEDDQEMTSFARDMFERFDETGESADVDAPAPETAGGQAPAIPRPQAFTTAFDSELPLSAVLPDTVFNEQAERLAEKYRQQHAEARRLSRALALALRSRRQSDWQFDQEEGLIDASRLAQIVAAPHRRRTFKQEYQSQDLDAAITLLVDCSGSMRGKWMDLTVLALQALGDALSLSAVPFEVLGFTTAATNGGQSLAAWRDAGSPPPPEGAVWRLNDLRHYVLKGFGQPWRQPRLQVPGLCDAGLLKENIDHEALSWALRRLRLVPTTRRVLVVISDGAPSCSTTERHAGGEALPQALRDLLAETSDIEIYALGLRHRAEAFYQRAVSITAEADLIPRLMDLTREIMTRPAAR